MKYIQQILGSIFFSWFLLKLVTNLTHYLLRVNKHINHCMEILSIVRIQTLEKKVLVDKGTEPESLVELKEKVDEFKEKLEVR